MRKEESGKYLLLKNLAMRQVGLEMIRQPCFANKVWLKDPKSRKPIPPWLLPRHTNSQLIQCYFFSLLFCPHQKLAANMFISWQREPGSLKQDIVYTGIAEATALIKVSFPLWDRSCSFHLASLCWIFLMTSSNVCFFDLESTTGIQEICPASKITNAQDTSNRVSNSLRCITAEEQGWFFKINGLFTCLRVSIKQSSNLKSFLRRYIWKNHRIIRTKEMGNNRSTSSYRDILEKGVAD